MTTNSNEWNGAVAEDSVSYQLLAAGKNLMKVIYQYNDKEDYLPESYAVREDYPKGEKKTPPTYSQSLTDYKHHIETTETSVFWSKEPQGNLAWGCKDDLVTELEYKADALNPSSDGYLCLTDCSGFIIGLFAFCNKVGGMATSLPTWQLDAAYKVSQAKDFFTFIQNGKHFNRRASIDEVQPGDIMAFEYHSFGHQDTGHVMLITATGVKRTFETNAASIQAMNMPENFLGPINVVQESIEIVIMDETTSHHTDDTRQSFVPYKVGDYNYGRGGLGMGKARIGMIQTYHRHHNHVTKALEWVAHNEPFIGFFWGDHYTSTLEYPVEIGCPLKG